MRIRKDKMDFPTPMKQWLAAELYAPVRDLLAGRDVLERGIYNPQAILRDLEAHRRGANDVSERCSASCSSNSGSECSRSTVPATIRHQHPFVLCVRPNRPSGSCRPSAYRHALAKREWLAGTGSGPPSIPEG
jgi:hypothetical protein